MIEISRQYSKLDPSFIDEAKRQIWTIENRCHLFYANSDFTSFLYGTSPASLLDRTNFVTLELTPGAYWLKLQKFNDIQSNELAWSLACHLFAKAAKGSTYALVHDATVPMLLKWGERSADKFKAPELVDQFTERRDRRPHWLVAELPTLLSNYQVTSINNVPISDLRDFLANAPNENLALRKISRERGVAALALPDVEKFFGGFNPPSGGKIFSMARPPDLPSSSGQFNSPSVHCSPLKDSNLVDKQEIFGTWPGGVVSYAKAVVPTEINSIRIDARGKIIVNESSCFRSGLTAEETLVLFDAIFETEAGIDGIGALDMNETTACYRIRSSA